MDNQQIIQSKPAIFFIKVRNHVQYVGITVGKERPPNADRRLGEQNMYWPHIWWLIQAAKRGVDCNEH
jgi:hypothetical protein